MLCRWWVHKREQQQRQTAPRAVGWDVLLSFLYPSLLDPLLCGLGEAGVCGVAKQLWLVSRGAVELPPQPHSQVPDSTL